MTTIRITQRQLDELTIRLGNKEDEINRLQQRCTTYERLIERKDAALVTAAELMAEADGMLERWDAATTQITSSEEAV